MECVSSSDALMSLVCILSHSTAFITLLQVVLDGGFLRDILLLYLSPLTLSPRYLLWKTSHLVISIRL